MSESGALDSRPSDAAVAGTTPLRAAPTTVTPRACSSRVNAVAAPAAGLAGLNGSPINTPSSTINAPSGPASMERIPSPQVGT